MTKTEETFEEFEERIHKEVDEWIRTHWIGILALGLAMVAIIKQL